MAVEGKTILQTTERTELTGKEGIPFQEGMQNGHVLLEKIRRFVMDGLFETDQFGADIFVLPKGGKLVTWVDDAAQIPLVFYKEYDNGEKQVEVGSPQRHLNLNSPDMVTVELPGGKKEKLLTESQLGKATSEKDGLMSKEDKAKVDGIQFNANENSILFEGKKYGVHKFNNVSSLNTNSTAEQVLSALNVSESSELYDLAHKGVLFIDTISGNTIVKYEDGDDTFQLYVPSSNLRSIKKLTITVSSNKVTGLTTISHLIVDDIRNTLTSAETAKVLSAAMGKKLQDEKLDKTDVVDNLTTDEASKALSAAQGKALNDKIAEISNPASVEKDGLMSKEDKKVLDNMKDGGAIEYKEISGQTVDADDLIVPKLTVRYLNKNASTAENISNIPAKGGFVLESMCVRYVDEDNCGYIQTYYSQNSDSRILPFSLTRQYTNGTWTEWRSTVGRCLCVNEAYKKVGTTFLSYGFQVGNIFDRSIVKDGALAISTQDVALHLTGVKNSTTYKVVSNASVGYWMMKTCPEQFFHAGKVAVSEDKTSESDETKKEYVAEVVSVDAEEGTVTFSKTLNPYTDFNDYSASFKAYAENGSLCLSAGTSTFLGIAGEECVAGAESADGCVALGDRCVSTGGCSVALCWQTVARNFAETALGISNKSHKGDSADKQTLFSIGNGTQYFNDWGTAKQKNAMEVMKNGDVYIEGVGGYDGINDGFTAQSVQDVISGFQSEISALKEEIEALKGSGA